MVRLLKSQLVNNYNIKSSSEDTSGGGDGFINTVDLIKLIKQANDVNRAQTDNSRSKFRLATQLNLNRIIENIKSDTDDDDYNNNEYTKNRILDQLNKLKTKPLKKKHLIPNKLLSPNLYKYEDEDWQRTGSLSKYSKMYVVLDPIALQKSRNMEDLPSL